jgi:hypothetical protein
MGAAIRNLLVVISRLEEIPNPSLLRNLVGNTDTGEPEKLRSTAQIRAQMATNAFRLISKGTPTPLRLLI